MWEKVLGHCGRSPSSGGGTAVPAATAFPPPSTNAGPPWNSTDRQGKLSGPPAPKLFAVDNSPSASAQGRNGQGGERLAGFQKGKPLPNETGVGHPARNKGLVQPECLS
eukprot:CAMPEP_0119132472 /NCGR_PEP_ID=MMETSP1310-20130426/11858_1 /TAXON_ID=464262 /ORGANISM="Genus nov. species nov., Strain RCC2339" /LENGTH=108 /DNA_ID=CAMNT_0007123109 /DNA_START=224 /DNA_END=549 /DNA_ORIENTATION=+